MKYSREHTKSGHSEYQDAILKEFDNEKYAIFPTLTDAGVITVITNGEYSTSILITELGEDGNKDYCNKMNEFLGKAYMFFFGTEFDGPVESK